MVQEEIQIQEDYKRGKWASRTACTLHTLYADIIPVSTGFRPTVAKGGIF